MSYEEDIRKVLVPSSNFFLFVLELKWFILQFSWTDLFSFPWMDNKELVRIIILVC